MDATKDQSHAGYICNGYRTIEQYRQDVKEYGMGTVWDGIMRFLSEKTGTQIECDKNEIVSVQTISELYEAGLECEDKAKKKGNGQYYTPNDVADLLADFLYEINGDIVCDVCCGTGTLILSYLKRVGEEEAKAMMRSGSVHLYDMDATAVRVCVQTISILYGKDCADRVVCHVGDFLNRDTHLPAGCKVISNPPYIKIREIRGDWDRTEVIENSREMYAAIMEKVLRESTGSVVITPQGFIGDKKFYALRKEMNDRTGLIFSFDNVPGNIFCGKKKGVFNTNTANSTRAAITVTFGNANAGVDAGYRCSGMIRFKNAERDWLLKKDNLLRYIGTRPQRVSEDNKRFAKCDPELENVFALFTDKTRFSPMSDFVCDGTHADNYALCVPNTCRYVTIASVRDLSRDGKIRLHFETQESRDLAYCLINSSFCYWYWRLYDGAITYSKSLLMSMPFIPAHAKTSEKEELLRIAKEMQGKEEEYLVYKKNAGELQENIKWPCKYREKLNETMLKIMGLSENKNIFAHLHENGINIDAEP